MKTVTVRNIQIGSYLKWNVIAYLLSGTLTGLGQAILVYLQTGTLRYLFWYVFGLPVLYVAVGIVAAPIFALLYNSLNKSIGGYKFEIEFDELSRLEPPPPPSNLHGASEI